MSAIETAVQDNADRIIVVENEKIPKVQKEIQRVERDFSNKLLAVELHDRKLNLLMYGVPTRRNEDVEAVVKEKIALFMNTTTEMEEVKEYSL